MLLRRSSNTYTLEAIIRHVYGYEVNSIKPKKNEKVNKYKHNPYLQYCTNLRNTTFVFAQMIDIDMVNNSADKIHWISEVYNLLPNYIDREIVNSDEDIEYITKICDVLLNNNMYEAYEALILNSSDSFLSSYVNIQKNPQILFYRLKHAGLQNLCNYLWNYLYVDNALLDYNI